jgi:hypothetical protein
MATKVLISSRESLVHAIGDFAHMEIETSSMFVVKIGDLKDQIMEQEKVKSHISNLLSRGNDVVINRLLGDARGGTVADSIRPFAVIEIAPPPMDPPHAVVKFTVGMFGLCPAMEKAFIDLFSRRLSLHSILLDSPSPIFRTILSGGLVHAPTRKPKPGGTNVPPVGMGSGESFYTYKPDMAVLNRFMLYHAWETLCPPASVQADVLTHIHEERVNDGWKCLHETSGSLLYAEFSAYQGLAFDQSVQPSPIAHEMTKLFLPFAKTKIRPRPKPATLKLELVDTDIDWTAFPAAQNPINSEVISGRQSLRAMCTCLHVQYVQQRGDKPFLKCQLWIDRGHPEWTNINDDDLAVYAKSLCHFDIS